jgi:hypothetical protein
MRDACHSRGGMALSRPYISCRPGQGAAR